MQQDFTKQFVLGVIDAIEKGTRDGYRMIWSWIQHLVREHWGMILGGVAVLFVVSIIEYLVTRRWGMFASVSYRFLYAIILFTLATFFGSDIFTEWWFDIILVVVCILCFETVGYFLRKTGIRKINRRKNY